MNALVDWLYRIPDPLHPYQNRRDVASCSGYQRADLSRHLLLCALSVDQCEAQWVTRNCMNAHWFRTLSTIMSKPNLFWCSSFLQICSIHHSVSVITCCKNTNVSKTLVQDFKLNMFEKRFFFLMFQWLMSP